MGTKLTVYRGEKKENWPEPEIRLVGGMRVRKPWHEPPLFDRLWERLKEEVSGQPGATPKDKAAAYAQCLRGEGRPFALATAWTDEGSYKSDYNYAIQILDAHFFAWGESAVDLGEQLNLSPDDKVKADFIVLDAPTLERSTVLGFGHDTATKEITFFSDLPIEFIKSCNDKAISCICIKSKIELSLEEKIKYSYLMR